MRAAGSELVRDDRGSIAPLVPIVMFALFVLGGLVVDGSRALNAHGNAQAYAEEAARAGATAIDETSSRLKLVDKTARQRVALYCDAIRGTTHANVTVTSCGLQSDAFTGAKTCDGSTQQIVVHAQVTLHVDTTLLGMVGFTEFSESGQAAARPFEGSTKTGDGRC